MIYDYETRFIKTYGYCEGYYAGFIRFLDKKYQFKNKPQILRFTETRNPGWAIFGRNENYYDESKYKIFLGYNRDNFEILEKINISKYKFLPMSKHNNKYISSISVLSDSKIDIENVYLKHPNKNISNFSRYDFIYNKVKENEFEILLPIFTTENYKINVFKESKD